MKNEESSSGLIHALSFRLKNLNRFSIVALLGSIILFFTLEWILRSIEITKEAYPPKIVVTATFNEDDAFTVYYMPNSESQYSDEQSVSHYIRSKKKEQSFVFNLPDSRLIKKIRFDLGRNEMQKEIEIKQVYLSYDNRDLILFDAKTGVNLFHVDHGVTLHKKGRFVLDPPNNSYYDPYLYTDDISAQYSSMLGRKVGLPFHTLVSFICTLSLLLYVLLFQQRLRLRTIFYSFASCFFVAILLFPFIIEFFNLSSGENLEKRALAEKPVLNKNNLVAYPKLYENYYNDNFGFRNELVKLGAKIKYNIFGSSSIPSKASIGKDGWIFLSGSFYHVTEDLQRSNLFTKHTLDSTLNNWIQKKSELEKDSIQFYKAVWPDKHYIYPEFMPRIMTIL
ncbi:MAG: hypothetical protein JNL60_19740, partial [Bacteroidia bacterium]|nr:hypothetical protein [Bacteroidia bacterium]